MSAKYTIDVADPTKWWEGYAFNFSDLGEEQIGIEITSSNPNVYKNNYTTVQNLHIEGPGKEVKNTVGIKINKAPFVTLEHCNVSKFSRGIEFGDDTWCNTIINASVYRCELGIHFPYGTRNAGENIRFFGSTIFNNWDNVYVNGANLTFYGCAFDYPYDSQITVTKWGFVTLHGCHIEHQAKQMAYNNNMLLVNDDKSGLSIRDAVIYISGEPSLDDHASSLIYNSGQLILKGVRISNLQTNNIIEGVGKNSVGELWFIGPRPKNIDRNIPWWNIPKRIKNRIPPH